jgi:hypothetical protein
MIKQQTNGLSKQIKQHNELHLIPIKIAELLITAGTLDPSKKYICLPVDLWKYIFNFFDIRELFRLRPVNRTFIKMTITVLKSRTYGRGNGSLSLSHRDYEEVTCDKFKKIISDVKNTLRHLDLWRCYTITDTWIQCLNQSNKFEKLQHLDLSHCDLITDTGLNYLETLSLRYLDLSGCTQITDTGIHCLTRLPLQHLDLSGCKHITDAGIHCLKALLNLQHLDLTACDQIPGFIV